MEELKKYAKGFASRKWLVTVGVLAMTYQLPMSFKKADVSEAVTLMALGIIAAAGTAYGILNVKDSKPQ